MFVAAEPLTEALTWSKGHDYVVRLRPNTYEQGRMLADKAGKMKYVKWATIGPNYEYGKRAWDERGHKFIIYVPALSRLGH